MEVRQTTKRGATQRSWRRLRRQRWSTLKLRCFFVQYPRHATASPTKGDGSTRQEHNVAGTHNTHKLQCPDSRPVCQGCKLVGCRSFLLLDASESCLPFLL